LTVVPFQQALSEKELLFMSQQTIIDVRTIPPRQRHPLIFSTFDSLRPAEAFELVNDHDPKPLYYQFAAEHHGRFAWEYLETGPEIWRVRIGKTAVSAPTQDQACGCGGHP
jgi:uncharacterized protein (DUF2249 family)